MCPLLQVPVMLDMHAQRAAAAVRIQSVWRGALLRASLLVAMAGCAVVNRAAICLQRWCRWLNGCTQRLQLCTELYAYAALLQQPTAPVRTTATATATATAAVTGLSRIDSSGSLSDGDSSDEDSTSNSSANDCKLYIELEVYYAITMDITLDGTTTDTGNSNRSPFRHLDNRAYNVPVWAHTLCTSSSGSNTSSSSGANSQNCKRLSNMTTADLLMRGVTRTGKLVNTSTPLHSSSATASTAAVLQQKQQQLQQRFVVLQYASQAEACMRALHVYARTWTQSKRSLVTLATKHMLQLAATTRVANTSNTAVEMLTRSSSSGRQRKLMLPQCSLPSAWCCAVRSGMIAHDEVRINLLGQSLMLPAMSLNSTAPPAVAAAAVQQGKLQLCYDDADATAAAATAVTSKTNAVQRSSSRQQNYDSRCAQYKQLTDAVAAVYAGNSNLFIPHGATAPSNSKQQQQQQQCSLTGVDTAGSTLNSVWQTSCTESDYAAVKALNCGWQDSGYKCNGNGYTADVVRLEVAVARRVREAQAQQEMEQK
jgi:IQ calmodulin-binding motif